MCASLFWAGAWRASLRRVFAGRGRCLLRRRRRMIHCLLCFFIFLCFAFFFCCFAFCCFLVHANGAICDPMAKCKFRVLVVKMLRHMWVGWGWGGVGHWQRSCWCYATHSSTQQPQGTWYATCDEDATPHVGWVGMGRGTDKFLLMLRNSPLYAATTGDKVRNMCWRCYATCGLGGDGVGWGTDNVPVDATQLTALRNNRRGQGTQHVMKMLRHMWVGWGWGGALINSCWCDATQSSAGDKVCNMWWRCYATCGLGGDGVGWGTDNVPVDATQLTALRSNRRGQGTQHVMKMLRHMWVGWGWGGVWHW